LGTFKTDKEIYIEIDSIDNFTLYFLNLINPNTSIAIELSKLRD